MQMDVIAGRLLADMAHATAWINFTTAHANYDLQRFGAWRCDYAHQAAVFQADYENAGRELIGLSLSSMSVDPLLKEMANRLNNCLVLLENYQGSGADARMIEKSKLTLKKYQQSKARP